VPAGAGNVSTALPFGTLNALITTDIASSANNIKETFVTLDASNNLSGLNTVNANVINAPTINGTASNATTAVNFTGALVGDVTGTQPSTVVSSVGGQSAANVAAGVSLANASTPGNAPNQIVRRDGAGDFSANTITATSFIGNVTGNLNGNATSATTATSATNFTGLLSGDVIGTQTATIVSTVGGQSAAAIGAATVLANTATSNNTANTIVRRDALGNFSTTMITINGAVLNPTDVTTKEYVDAAVATGIKAKEPAEAVSVTNVALTGLQTVDGVSLVANDRVLLVAQTNPVENGLWLVQVGPWTRPADFASGTLAGQAYVLILMGTVNAGTSWLCNTPAAVIDTDPISFVPFSIPGQTTAANVGVGQGQFFRDKTGNTLNFKTLLAGTHLSINNNTNEVGLLTDATDTATPNTLVARDALGNFSANTITASLTGAASLNVLKAGDTMTGPLNMAAQTEVRWEDSAGGEYVGLRAPAVIGSSYTVDLPASAPTNGQVLQAVSPAATQWATIGGSPSVAKTYYVSLSGSDSNPGSLSAPFRTVAQAVTVANSVASVSNPIVISVGAGIFVENNTGGPIVLTAEGISIVGASMSSTIISPQDLSIDLFLCSVPNIEFFNFTVDAGALGSTATGIEFNANSPGVVRFENIVVYRFAIGFELTSAAGVPIVIFENVQPRGNGVGVTATNIRALIKNSAFLGPISGTTPTNTAISCAGTTALITVLSSSFRLLTNGISLLGGAQVRLVGGNIETTTNGVVATGGSDIAIVGTNFVFNNPGAINVSSSDAGTTVIMDGAHFQCNDAAGTPQGTALRAFNNGVIAANACSIFNALVGIQCGNPGDTATTEVEANGTSLRNCTTDIIQNGISTLRFVGGVFEPTLVVIANPTNVAFAAFDTDVNDAFTIGNTIDSEQVLYQILTDQAVLPNLSYNPDYYGFKGTVFKNENNTATFNATQAAQNNAHYFVVTEDRTKEAGITFISDTGNVGNGDERRGWSLTKTGTNASLVFTYTNSDTVGQGERGATTVMQLDGFNNLVEFPLANNSPLPTNLVARLVWAGDTNLYRSAANLLRTDGNLIVGALTANRAVATDGNSQLVASITTDTELGYLAGATSPIQPQLNNKVNRSGDTMTGALQLPAGFTNAPSLNFSGSPTTGLSANLNVLSLSTTGSQRLSIDASGTVTINQFSTAGVVHNDASGTLSTSLIVNSDISSSAAITDDKLATITSAGKVANSATTATIANVPNAIVLRDASGNFTANVITATLNGNAASATTSLGFTGSLSGDVTGTQGATIVATVGGQTAASIASATALVNTSTSNAVPNTLVLRDASGNFAANVITASLNGNATTATTATTATNFTGSLVGDVTGTQGATVVSTVGGQTAANVAAGTVLANGATSANTANAIVRRDGSGNFSAGTITGSLTGAASLNVLRAGDTMTGALQLPTGAIATPALRFTGSLTTGISVPTADNFVVSTAGLERLRIDANGNTTFRSNYKMNAYRSSNQSINNTTATIVFDTETLDPNANYNNATGVYTVPFTGSYLIMAVVTAQTAAQPATQTVNIVRNGTAITGASASQVLSTNNARQPITTTVLVNLTAGDLIRIDFTTNKNDTVVANDTHLTITYVSF